MRYEISYDGHIDTLDQNGISGWARQIGTERPVKLSVLINDTDKLVVTADRERPDLKGNWGFSVSTTQLKLLNGDKIRIKIANDNFELRNSPIFYNIYTNSEPWVESDLYPEYRKARADSEFVELADHYHENGYVLLKGTIDHDLIDNIIRDTRPLLVDENRGGRVQDAWRSLPSVRNLALNEQVLKLLEFFYERNVVPFQTLNFEFGTQQPAHSDTIHFSCLPARFMAGAWVALEPTTDENGPLIYYPGSHRLKEYRLSDIGILPNPISFATKSKFAGMNGASSAYSEYEKFMARLMKACGFEEKRLIADKGDVLIWASNLVHGGSEIKVPDRTRWSQVTHYYFDGCLYYTPLYSDEIAGDYALKEITSVATTQIVPNTYNGLQLKIVDIGNNLSKIKL